MVHIDMVKMKRMQTTDEEREHKIQWEKIVCMPLACFQSEKSERLKTSSTFHDLNKEHILDV